MTTGAWADLALPNIKQVAQIRQLCDDGKALSSLTILESFKQVGAQTSTASARQAGIPMGGRALT